MILLEKIFLKSLGFGFSGRNYLISFELQLCFFLFKVLVLFIKITPAIMKIDHGANVFEKVYFVINFLLYGIKVIK